MASSGRFSRRLTSSDHEERKDSIAAAPMHSNRTAKSNALILDLTFEIGQLAVIAIDQRARDEYELMRVSACRQFMRGTNFICH